MKQYVAEVLPLLGDLDRLIARELVKDHGRGPGHMAAALGISERRARTHLARLVRYGVCEYGPLFHEDDGSIAGRGYWLSPFGAAIRAGLDDERQPRGEIADMVDRISSVNAPDRSRHVAVVRHPTPPIGLSGYAGTGKTEAARFIESAFGYERRHIAEPLRRMLASLLREYGLAESAIESYLTGDMKDGPAIPMFGVTSRHLQITLGTEWGREQVDQAIWAKLWSHQAAMAQKTGGKPSMNDSVRFANEEEAIRAIGGITILIVRPGTGPAAFKWRRLGPALYRWFGCMWGVHDSERVDRLTPDYVIVNDGTIDDLHVKIASTIAKAQCALALPYS